MITASGKGWKSFGFKAKSHVAALREVSRIIGDMQDGFEIKNNGLSYIVTLETDGGAR